MFRLPRSFSSGEPRCWRRVGGLLLAEVDYAPRQAVRETHARARFVLVLRGGFEGDRDGRPGSVRFVAAQDPQALVASAAGACRWPARPSAWRR